MIKFGPPRFRYRWRRYSRVSAGAGGTGRQSIGAFRAHLCWSIRSYLHLRVNGFATVNSPCTISLRTSKALTAVCKCSELINSACFASSFLVSLIAFSKEGFQCWSKDFGNQPVRWLVTRLDGSEILAVYVIAETIPNCSTRWTRLPRTLTSEL